MILNLGVVDVPYSQHGTKWSKARAGTETTGDVAEILEENYGLMQAFYDAHSADIARDLENSVAGALESFIMGAPVRNDQFGAGTSKIEERFRDFLSTKEAERVGIPGAPTLAALRGVSHRFKHPYKRRPPRPSFIDTGLLQASFRAWIE